MRERVLGGNQVASGYPYLWTIVVFSILINGFLDKIIGTVQANGLLYALAATFNVSLMIWMAAGYALILISKSPVPFYRSDYAVISVSLICCLVPDSRIAWIALTVVGVYMFIRFGSVGPYRQASEILVAISFVGLWSKAMMRLFLEYILYFDTVLVSTLTQLPRSENLIFTGSNGVILEVGEECSAFQNLALVVLAWVVFRNVFNAKGLIGSLSACVLCGIIVVVINTIRIGVIAWRPDLYDLAHGPVGAAVAGNLTAVLVCAICYIFASKYSADA